MELAREERMEKKQMLQLNSWWLQPKLTVCPAGRGKDRGRGLRLVLGRAGRRQAGSSAEARILRDL